MYRTYPGKDGHPTRNLNGSPETPAHKRYFALRESGYTGWINEDGYAVDGPPEWPTPASVMVDARPTDSYTLEAQRQGRVLREAERLDEQLAADLREADIRARLLDNPRAVDVLDGVYDEDGS